MKNLNPLHVILEISTKTLLKKRSLYSPEQWNKIISKLQKTGKENGGLHSPDVYGRRMKLGQLQRARALGSKYGKNIKFTQDPNKGAYSSFSKYHNNIEVNLPDTDKRHMLYADSHSINPFRKLKGKFRKYKHNRTYYSQIDPNKGKSKSLNDAITAHHEVEEISQLLRQAERNKLSEWDYINKINNRINSKIKNREGNHFPRVLGSEKRLSNRIETLYGPEYGNSLIRTPNELQADRISTRITR